MNLQKTPAQEQINRDNEWVMVSRLPKNFRKDDLACIKKFCKRMLDIRNIRNNEVKNNPESDRKQHYVKNQKAYTQESLAEALGVVPMTISKYEHYDFDIPDNKEKQDISNEVTPKIESSVPKKPKIKAIPMHHLRRICTFYNVTPHYILGLVDQEDGCLDIDEEGNVTRTINEEGKEVNKVLIAGVLFDKMEEIDVYEKYRNLALEHPPLYKLVNKLVCSTGKKRKLCVDVLTAIFDNT